MSSNEDSMDIGKTMSYLIIGGDDRLVELANIFSGKGCKVYTHGMERAANCLGESVESLEEAVAKSDVIIGPIPFSKETNMVNSLYSENPIEIDKLFGCITPDKKLFFGAMNRNSRERAEQFNIKYVDYHQDESYQIFNAIPTAEGAIALMISETDTSLFDSNVLVLGYGRIGNLLSEYTRFLGANVYVEARKEADLTWIKTKGMKEVPLVELENFVGHMDIIVNTVPAMMLDDRMLELMKKNVLLIDLASLPGGIDFQAAKARGIKAIHALGIPGKIAAKSAAKYIYDTVTSKLKG
jgi:dipicolinate synthase subunit A